MLLWVSMLAQHQSTSLYLAGWEIPASQFLVHVVGNLIAGANPAEGLRKMTVLAAHSDLRTVIAVQWWHKHRSRPKPQDLVHILSLTQVQSQESRHCLTD
eukprot:COSAG02_NODE_248_length_27133_cov_45.131723_18_plen_100_part_00